MDWKFHQEADVFENTVLGLEARVEQKATGGRDLEIQVFITDGFHFHLRIWKVQSEAEVLLKKLSGIDDPMELFDIQGIKLIVVSRHVDEGAGLQIALLLVNIEIHVGALQLNERGG